MRLLFIASLLCACGPAPLTPFTEPAAPLVHSDRSYLRDQAGRVVVMRGVNARVGGVFDVTFDDGRLPLEAIPTFDASDAARMRQMGLTLLRLPISWSALEPSEGTFDDAYLERVAAVVALCAAAQIHVIVDFHQDAYSKEIGEDGAPLWAIVPAPSMLLGGPLGSTLQSRVLSPQVMSAFSTFFVDGSADTERLQAAFTAMARHVAERFASEPYVLGYDLYNEPAVNDRYLHALHDRVARAIREVDTDHLLLFEPSGLRNLFEQAPLGQPFFDDGGVYAVHLYTFVFSQADFDLSMLTLDALRPNVMQARREAASFHVPMLVGEWGIGPAETNMALYVRYMHELFDETFSSATVWLWKEESQGGWGFFDVDAAGVWTERDAVRAAHARIVPERLAGEPGSMQFDAPSGHFALTFTGRTDAAPHWIVVPGPPDYAASFVVRCDGAEIVPTPARDPVLSRITVLCAGSGMHTLTIDPR